MLNTVWFHIYEVLRVVRIIKTENVMVTARDGAGRGDWGVII